MQNDGGERAQEDSTHMEGAIGGTFPMVSAVVDSLKVEEGALRVLGRCGKAEKFLGRSSPKQR